jgi:hypothetical protein
MAKEPEFVKENVTVRLTRRQRSNAKKIARKLGREGTISEGIREAIDYASKALEVK